MSMSISPITASASTTPSTTALPPAATKSPVGTPAAVVTLSQAAQAHLQSQSKDVDHDGDSK